MKGNSFCGTPFMCMPGTGALLHVTWPSDRNGEFWQLILQISPRLMG